MASQIKGSLKRYTVIQPLHDWSCLSPRNFFASLNVNPSAVSKYGGAYKIDSLPAGLKIIQQGKMWSIM